MKKLFLMVALLTPACAATQTVRDERIAEFKSITKDVCLDNEQEVKLAQHLYNEMINN